MNRPAITALTLADPPERWESIGFAVEGGGIDLGGVRVNLSGAAGGRGIMDWTLSGVDPVMSIDGLPTRTDRGASGAGAPRHPNGAVGLDHVVVVTPDFDRTQAALEAAGIALRRIRDAGGFRQGFRRLGPAILELVETPRADRVRRVSGGWS